MDQFARPARRGCEISRQSQMVNELTNLTKKSIIFAKENVMSPEFIARELDIQEKHVMARADIFESWEQYHERNSASLQWFNSDQLDRLRRLFGKHHSLEGATAAGAKPSSIPSPV